MVVNKESNMKKDDIKTIMVVLVVCAICGVVVLTFYIQNRNASRYALKAVDNSNMYFMALNYCLNVLKHAVVMKNMKFCLLMFKEYEDYLNALKHTIIMKNIKFCMLL